MKGKIKYYVTLIIFRALLDLCYYYIVSPKYDYKGMLNDASTGAYLLSWGIFLIFLPSLASFCTKEKLSANVLTLLFCFSFIPTTSLIGFINISPTFIAGITIYWFLLFLWNYLIPNFKMNVNYDGKMSKMFLFWLVLLCLVVLYISGTYTGFRFHFSLYDVYDLRFEEREFSMPIVIQYLHTASNILLPVMLVYFLQEKRYIIVGLLSVVILLNFGIGGHKSVIFMLALSFLGFCFFRFKRVLLYPIGLISICILSFSEYLLIGTVFVSGIMLYRVLFLPSLLHMQYFWFFNTRELDFFRQGILRWVGFSSPYEESIAFLIGGFYGGNYEERANNGLFSDAYMNLGLLGVFVFPIIVILILRFLDAVSQGLSEKLLILPILTTTMALLSTTFSTALLTSGLLLMMVILYYLPRKTKII